MSELVFLLEEASARVLLEKLLPRLLQGVSFRFIVFEGKQDLEKQLVHRLRGYRTPDELQHAADELARLTTYKYQKISGSRAIGPFLNLENSRSKSFAVFISGIKRLMAGIPNTAATH